MDPLRDKWIGGLEIVVNLVREDDGLLSPDAERMDRRSLDQLRAALPGTTARIVVGDRAFPGPSAVRLLQWYQQSRGPVVIMASTNQAGVSWRQAVDGAA